VTISIITTLSSDVACHLTSLLGFVFVLQTVTSSLYLAVVCRRAFSIARPTVCNSLPDELRDPACGSDSIKQFLKTILFRLY